MTLRRALVSAALAALVVSGCGGGGDSGGSAADGKGKGDVVAPEVEEAFQALTASSDATVEAGSARFSMEMSVDGAPSMLEVTMDGTIDLASGNGTFAMDLGALGLPGGGDVEARLVDGSIYMDLTAFGGLGLGSDAQWVRMDLSAMAEELGIDMSELGANDPSQFLGTLEALRGVSRDIELLGTDEVRGVETEHYRVVVDFDKALGEVPESLREQLGDSFAQFGLDTLPMDVWIDARDRLRRMRFEMGGDAFEDLGSGAVSMTMDLYDFGVEVEVEAPPAEDTVDFMELLGGVTSDV
jgi:hypothetical protein